MTNKNLIFNLVFFHCFIIGISNYLVQFPISFAGFDFTIATFTFPFIILATDLTVRLSGSREARRIIIFAFIPAFIISYYFADIRIAIASVAAYALGQLLDVFVFSKMRNKFNETGLKMSRYWFAAPSISTFFAQLIDTYLFYGVAFYQGKDEFMRDNWINIATNDFMFKLIICYFAFLPMYFVILNSLFSLIKRRAST